MLPGSFLEANAWSLLKYMMPLLKNKYADPLVLKIDQKTSLKNLTELELFLKRYDEAGLFTRGAYWLNYCVLKKWPSLQDLRKYFIYQRLREMRKSLKDPEPVFAARPLWLPRDKVFGPLYFAVSALQKINTSRRQFMFDNNSLQSFTFLQYDGKSFTQFFKAECTAAEITMLNIAYRKLVDLLKTGLDNQRVIMKKYPSWNKDLEEALKKNKQNTETSYMREMETFLKLSQRFQTSSPDKLDPFKGMMQIGNFMYASYLATELRAEKWQYWCRVDKPKLDLKLKELEQVVLPITKDTASPKIFSPALLWYNINTAERLYQECETFLEDIDKNYPILADKKLSILARISAYFRPLYGNSSAESIVPVQRVQASRQNLLKLCQHAVVQAESHLDGLYQSAVKKIDSLNLNEIDRAKEFVTEYKEQSNSLLKFLNSEPDQAKTSWQIKAQNCLLQKMTQHRCQLEEKAEQSILLAHPWITLGLESAVKDLKAPLKLAQNDQAQIIIADVSSRYAQLTQMLSSKDLADLNTQIAHYLSETEAYRHIVRTEGNLIEKWVEESQKQFADFSLLQKAQSNLTQCREQCVVKLLAILNEQEKHFNLSVLQSQLHVIGEEYTKSSEFLFVSQFSRENNFYRPFIDHVNEQKEQLIKGIQLVRSWMVDQTALRDNRFSQTFKKKCINYRALFLKYHPDKYTDPLLQRLAGIIAPQLSEHNPSAETQLSTNEDIAISQSVSERDENYCKRAVMIFKYYNAQIQEEFAILQKLSLKEMRQTIVSPVSTLSRFYKEMGKLQEEVTKDPWVSSIEWGSQVLITQYFFHLTSLQATYDQVLEMMQKIKEMAERSDLQAKARSREFKAACAEIKKNQIESSKKMRTEVDEKFEKQYQAIRVEIEQSKKEGQALRMEMEQNFEQKVRAQEIAMQQQFAAMCQLFKQGGGQSVAPSLPPSTSDASPALVFASSGALEQNAIFPSVG